MWPFRQEPPAPAGGTITIAADTRSIRRARTRLNDLRQAHAFHLRRPASVKRTRKLEQLEGAIRRYENALDDVRASLNPDRTPEQAGEG